MEVAIQACSASSQDCTVQCYPTFTQKLELITTSFTVDGPIVFDFVFCNLPGQADGGEEEADAGDGEGGGGEVG